MDYLVMLTGRQGAGKTTIVAPHFVDRFEFESIAIGDPIKRITLQMNPVFFRPEGILTPTLHEVFGDSNRMAYREMSAKGSGVAKKLPALRKFYEDMGISIREELGQDVFLVKSWRPRFIDFVEWAIRYDKPIRVLVDDIRMPNEPGYISQLWWNTLKAHGREAGARVHFVRVKSPKEIRLPVDSELERYIDHFKVTTEFNVREPKLQPHDLMCLSSYLAFRKKNWEQP